MGKKSRQQPAIPKRPIEVKLAEYNELYATEGPAQGIFVLFLCFGLSVLIWSIPFPHIDFLGRYNGFVNWFTFFMAIVVYYYLRLAPTLSYAILFSFGVFSFLIVQLEYWEQDGGPALWIAGLIAFALGLGGYLLSDGHNRNMLSTFKSISIAPLWFWHLAFKKLNIPY